MTDSDWMDDVRVHDLITLDMEYRLTIALRAVLDGKPCSCPQYLIDRRDALIPEILASAARQGRDPAELFHEFQKQVHARHGGDDD